MKIDLQPTREFGPVSEVIAVPSDTEVQDEPISSRYQTWGYTIGYLVDSEGQSLPEGSNTAFFRIAPGGMTEPVYVTKPEADSTFTIKAIRGFGRAVIVRCNGEYEEPSFGQDSVVIKPGDSYFYINDGDEDLILHDVATPKFKEGDDADLNVSVHPAPHGTPTPEKGYSSVVIETKDGPKVIELPNKFWDTLGRALRDQKTVQHLNCVAVPSFEREGFTGRIFVDKTEKRGFNAMQIDVDGSHPEKEIKAGNTRAYYVAEGSGFFKLNGQERKVKDGDYIEISEGGRYSYRGKMRLFEVNISPDNSFRDSLV
jgi:mannose-6-phosphate isomerase-like protein (cupin superfamily)